MRETYIKSLFFHFIALFFAAVVEIISFFGFNNFKFLRQNYNFALNNIIELKAFKDSLKNDFYWTIFL